MARRQGDPVVVRFVRSVPHSRSTMAKNASHHEQPNDGDELTAQNDAVDVNRRSKAHAVAVDHVHTSRFGREREAPTRTGPSTDAIGPGTLTLRRRRLPLIRPRPG
jgi:hypothetical protein